MELNQRVQPTAVKCILIPSSQNSLHSAQLNQQIHHQQHQVSQNQYQLNPIQQTQCYETDQSKLGESTTYRKHNSQNLHRSTHSQQSNNVSPTTVDSTMCHIFNDQATPNNAIENDTIEVERMKSPLQMTPIAHQYQQQKPMQSQPQPVQKPDHQKIIPFTQKTVYRSLNDMKVTELKRELKSRSMPVSGSKPNLIDRLRIYEHEICAPPDSSSSSSTAFHYTPPSSNGYNSPMSNSYTRPSSGSSQLEEYYEQEKTFEPPPKRSNSIVSYVQSPDGTLNPTNFDNGVGHLQSRGSESNDMFVIKAPTRKRPTIQKANDDGKAMGVSKIQFSGANDVNNTTSQPNLRRILTSNTHHSRQQQAHEQQLDSPQQQVASYGATAMPTSPFIQKTDNTFHFSQNGSGGEFTLCSSSNSSEYSHEQKNYEDMTQQQNINSNINTNVHSQVFNPPIQRTHVPLMKISKSISPEAASLFASPAVSTESSTNSAASSVYESDHNMMNHQYSNSHMPAQKMMLPPKVQDSPCAADIAGNSPDMPMAENLTYHQDASAVDESVCNTGLSLDSRTTQKLLSPETLQAHQQMIKEMSQQIDTLEGVLGKNLKNLYVEQEMIHTAKKQQQELRQKQNKSEMEKHCTSFGDISAMRENNLRNLEHYKKQQQLFTKQKEEHSRLEQIEARLVEEIHVGNSIEDIVRLIKQDSRTALLIISLLHKYRTERDEQNQSTVTQPPKEEHKKEPVTPPKTVKKQSARNSANSERFATSSDGRMDDIFKTVIGHPSTNVELKTTPSFSYQQPTTDVDQPQGDSHGQPDIIEVEHTKTSNGRQTVRRNHSNGNQNAIQINAQSLNSGQSTSQNQNHQIRHQHRDNQQHNNHNQMLSHEQVHHYDQGQSHNHIQHQTQNECHSQQLQHHHQQHQQQYISSSIPQSSRQNCMDHEQQNLNQNGGVGDEYGMQMMAPQQNQHVGGTVDSFDHLILDDDNFPNIDAMVEEMKKNEREQNNLQNNLAHFDSDDLDGVFDDDWINTVSKDLNHQGEYEPGNSASTSNEMDHGNYGNYPQNMEWMDKNDDTVNSFK